jgi:TPR repeat protein
MYRFSRTQLHALLVLIAFTSSVLAQTQQEQAEDLFQTGYTLYQQYYGAVAITPLEEAAKLGHAEAAYWVGEILRKRYSFITEEAGTFYRQAADGGEVYAMLRFAQKGNMCGTLRDCDYDHKQWLDRAEAAALARAETGDTAAMMELFSVFWMQGNEKAALNWTLKAAEAGDVVAQHWLAIGLLSEREMGFYWTEASRRNDILKWLRASAENGYPPAMLKLAITLRAQNDLEQARYWVEQMAQTDYYDAVVEAGTQIMMGPDVGEILLPSISYHFEKPRPVQGAALLMAIHRQTGSSAPMKVIDAYREHLTPEMLKKAETLSKELLVDTPIIYYLPKFGM